MPRTVRSRPGGSGGAASPARAGSVDARAAGRGQPLAERPPAPAAPRVTAPAPSRKVRRLSCAVGCAGRRQALQRARRGRPGRRVARRPRRAVSRPTQDRDAGHRRGHAGQRVDRAWRPGAASGGQGGEAGQQQHEATPSQVRRRARTPTAGGGQQGDHGDAAEQDRLVAGAEPGDGPLLDRRRGGVDDRGADREDGGRARGRASPATRCPTAMPATAASTPLSAHTASGGSGGLGRGVGACGWFGAAARADGLPWRREPAHPRSAGLPNIPAFLLTGGVIGLVARRPGWR